MGQDKKNVKNWTPTFPMMQHFSLGPSFKLKKRVPIINMIVFAFRTDMKMWKKLSISQTRELWISLTSLTMENWHRWASKTHKDWKTPQQDRFVSLKCPLEERNKWTKRTMVHQTLELCRTFNCTKTFMVHILHLKTTITTNRSKTVKV